MARLAISLVPLGALLGALLGVLLAACGPLPRPFLSEGKDLTDLQALDLRSRIVVLPLKADLAPEQRAQASEVLATALREASVPATTEGDPTRSRWLDGRAVVQRLNYREDEVLVYWELGEPDGRRIGNYSQRNVLPHGVWQGGLPEGIATVMGEAAGPIADLVRPPTIEEAPIPGFPDANVVLLPMDALPGDGPVTLRNALMRELLAAGLPMAEIINSEDLLVFGDIELGPDRGGVQMIEIIWYVIRASDNQELGQINQGNRIQTGSLNGPWGPTANAIAKGAAVGLLELLEQVEQIRS